MNSTPSPNSHAQPGPLFPWVGSKRGLIPILQPYFPPIDQIRTYHEPCIGAGHVFFHLRRLGFTGVSHLSDLSEKLVRCYEGIRQSPEEVIVLYHCHALQHSKEYFKQTRQQYQRSWSDAETAAWFLYVAKSCSRGVYRENRAGVCNSLCRGPVLSSLNEDALIADSHHLQNARLSFADFASVLTTARQNDFAMFDPPYPDGFTGYTSIGFDESDHHRLHRVCLELHRRGCLFMQTNADCEFIRRLYRDFHIESVIAPRQIANGRDAPTKARELLIMNY